MFQFLVKTIKAENNEDRINEQLSAIYFLFIV